MLLDREFETEVSRIFGQLLLKEVEVSIAAMGRDKLFWMGMYAFGILANVIWRKGMWRRHSNGKPGFIAALRLYVVV